MNRILDALRSPGAMMVALVLALFPQGEHTAQVFAFFSHNAEGSAQFFSYAFAAAVEVAVLLFVLAGHRRISYLFAGASFLTNVVYYAIGGVVLLSVAAFPVLLLSALLPACIVGYSHTIADVGHATPATKQPAKVRRYRWQFWRKPLETPAELPTPNDTTPAPIVAPSPSGGHSEAAGKSRKPRTGAKAGKLTQEQRRAQIKEQELQSYRDVMRVFNVSKRTADGDLAEVRKAVLQTNGTGVH